jgi:hypothetical protein
MHTTYIDIVLEGEKFSPKRLKELTNLDIETLAEYGEIGIKGRYKGKSIPYGLALLKVQHTSSEDINVALKKVIDELLYKKAYLSSSGVDEITLDLENFSQHDMEITIDREIIKKISDLNAGIDISSSSNFENYIVPKAYPDGVKTKPLRYAEKYLVSEIYSSILSNKQLTQIIPHQQSERLRQLFKEKINNDRAAFVGISYSVLMSAMIIYIIKYIQEDNYENIPSFEKVLNENYS